MATSIEPGLEFVVTATMIVADVERAAHLSVFLNLPVTDIKRVYERRRSRGATFITEPKTHAKEPRCYMRDPDGYLIEVGQARDGPTRSS